jgi:hypothetical protein
MAQIVRENIGKIDGETSGNFGFPRHDISPQKKNKKWHLQYSKAFHNEFHKGNGKFLRWAKDDYEKWRLYARGKQPIDTYKTLLGLKKNNGKWNQTWRNLDWNILPIFPRFKTVIKNRLLKLPRFINIQAIDQTSMSKEKERRAKMMNFISGRDFYEKSAEDLGIPNESPFEPGEPVPANSNEVDINMQMYPKNHLIMLMRDQLELTLYNNDWKQIEESLIDDGIDVGTFGTHTWLDINGAIRVNRVIGERMISNIISQNDFSDMIRIGRYEEITISQLRSQVEKGTFTEEDYASIAATASKNDYSVSGNTQYFEEHNCFPYDHEKITILRWECFSSDDTAYIKVKPENGNTSFQKRDNPGWLGNKSDEDYEKFHKEQGEERKIIRDSVNNLYGAVWIVDTEYVYNYGRINNMIRSMNSLRDVESGYTMYTLDFDSIVRQCEATLDNIQINWLQYQHHLAQSKPKGLAIEKRALQQVDLGNGTKLSAGKILQMYAETGSYIYVGTDQNGRPYQYQPIMELKGGISEAALQHLNFIIMQIDMLRGILGLNEVTDGSSVDPKLGKAVSEMVQFNTNNALGTLYHGFISIYERTLRKISYLVPDALSNPNKAMEDSVGADNIAFIKAFRDTPFVEFGIKIEVGMTEELRERLTGHLNASLKVNGGTLLPEDAFVIENEPNIHRAYLLLAQKRRHREEEQLSAEMAKMKQQADGNTETAVALEQEKRATAEAEVELYEQKKSIDVEGELLKIREKAQWDIIAKKIDAGVTLSVAENKMVENLMVTEMKIRGDIQKAKIGAKNKEKSVVKK